MSGARCLPFREGLHEAASSLRSGGLVAFPTETVYGLGANALQEDAVLRIFHAKGRPLTDPVIVHVSSLEDAERLTAFGESSSASSSLCDSSDSEKMCGSPRKALSEQSVFRVLARALWPGPLTLVVRAASCVPKVVCAGGDFVGIRFPSHHQAQDLLHAAGIPIAAPSANRFGHVSPTSAEHVMSDLGHINHLIVLDGEKSGVGIESTVLRIEETGHGRVSLTILRQGGLTIGKIQAALRDEQINDLVDVAVLTKHASGKTAEIAPGQLLTHYAPDVPAFLIDDAEGSDPNVIASTSTSTSPTISPRDDFSSVSHDESYQLFCSLDQAVVLDFGGRFSELSSKALEYADLSPSGSDTEAASEVFSKLRWSELVDGARIVLIPRHLHALVSAAPDGNESLLSAVEDRLFRAASGRCARIQNHSVYIPLTSPLPSSSSSSSSS